MEWEGLGEGGLTLLPSMAPCAPHFLLPDCSALAKPSVRA